MIFSVVYLQSAEDELAEVWLNASDPKAVEEASNLIDRLLRVDAHRRGQSFYGDRILVVAPLAITFSVSINDRMVKVLQVQKIA